jgi:hypothetical protein
MSRIVMIFPTVSSILTGLLEAGSEGSLPDSLWIRRERVSMLVGSIASGELRETHV